MPRIHYDPDREVVYVEAPAGYRWASGVHELTEPCTAVGRSSKAWRDEARKALRERIDADELVCCDCGDCEQPDPAFGAGESKQIELSNFGATVTRKRTTPQWLTVTDVAEHHGVQSRTVRVWITQGLLPATPLSALLTGLGVPASCLAQDPLLIRADDCRKFHAPRQGKGPGRPAADRR